jgi:glutaredoxin
LVFGAHGVSITRGVELAFSSAASCIRAFTGTLASPAGDRPRQLLELYEFEACPYCRKAREALSALRLDYLARPCPKNGTRYRPRVEELGGKRMFPYLVDPNTGTSMYESDDIIAYLYGRYGAGTPPLAMKLPILTDFTASLASLLYSGGFSATASKLPEKPLGLVGTEASPSTRIVRSRLCALEIPYVMKCSEADSTRPIPQLEDPNASNPSFVAVGAGPALRYLQSQYASV